MTHIFRRLTLRPHRSFFFRWAFGRLVLVRTILAGMSALAGVSAAALPTPSQPILVVQNLNHSANPLSGYITEILRSEGLLEFQEVQLADLTSGPNPAAYLANFAVVLLAETGLSPAEAELFQQYVSGGGRLIAMRPDTDLSDLFGISFLGSRPEQPLQFFAVDTNAPAGAGLVPLSLQYHGQADNYRLNGAHALAWLWDSLTAPSTNPAVVLNTYGQGMAVAFAFDLARSVVLTRQGNPEWSDSEGDGSDGYRPGDCFFRLNGEKWVAPERMRIPQADEAQRFLANILAIMCDTPLPRLWYLPGGKKALLVNTGDAEGMGGAQLEHTLNGAASYGGTFTSYLMESGIALTDPAREASWRAAGHEIGPHVYGQGSEDCSSLGLAYQGIVLNLLSKFGHGGRTARSHTIDWCGWVAMAAIEENYGTGMDLNYYHYFPQLLAYGENANGYFTGSGLPQRLCVENGVRLSIYQAATQWPDEWFDNSGYTADEAFEIMRSMLVAAENGFYSALVANIHHVRYDNVSGDITYHWANRLWGYAQSNGIPMWSAEKLLDFVQTRNDARFENMEWDGTSLSFDFLAPHAGQDLTIMIPAQAGGRGLSTVAFDDVPVTPWIERIKGRDYAMFTTQSGAGKLLATYAAVRFVQTSVADFSSGVLENVVVAEDGNGELRLPPVFYDRFAEPALNGQWTSGLWPGGAYAPAVEGGTMSLEDPGSGAFVRSVSTFLPATKVRAKLKFSKGGSATAPYLYFGLAGENLQPWALVGTGYSGTSLYTTVFNNRPKDPIEFNLGNLFDEWHEFEIDWQAAQIGFWMDGVLRRTENISLAGPCYLFFSVAGATPAGASVAADWVRVEDYGAQAGNVSLYTSEVLDAGWLTAWQRLEWIGTVPPGTGIGFETRSGDNPTVDAAWSDWQLLSNPIANPQSRCIQFRVTLSTSNTLVSPVIEEVSISGVTIPEPPGLETVLSGTDLHLRWPAWAPGLALFSTTNLQAPVVWSPSAGHLVLTNGWYQTFISATNRGEFFRLAPN